jgi:hypothetical protein
MGDYGLFSRARLPCRCSIVSTSSSASSFHRKAEPTRSAMSLNRRRSGEVRGRCLYCRRRSYSTLLLSRSWRVASWTSVGLSLPCSAKGRIKDKLADLQIAAIEASIAARAKAAFELSPTACFVMLSLPPRGSVCGGAAARWSGDARSWPREDGPGLTEAHPRFGEG